MRHSLLLQSYLFSFLWLAAPHSATPHPLRRSLTHHSTTPRPFHRFVQNLLIFFNKARFVRLGNQLAYKVTVVYDPTVSNWHSHTAYDFFWNFLNYSRKNKKWSHIIIHFCLVALNSLLYAGWGPVLPSYCAQARHQVAAWAERQSSTTSPHSPHRGQGGH